MPFAVEEATIYPSLLSPVIAEFGPFHVQDYTSEFFGAVPQENRKRIADALDGRMYRFARTLTCFGTQP